MVWLSLIFPLIGFVIQYYPRFFNNYFGIDVWTRLLEIDAVRKAQHKIPEVITKGFLIPGKFDYPPVFPWLFSYFPKRWLEKNQGLVSPFFDALTNLLVFAIAVHTMGDIRIGLAAQAVYTFIPMIVLENSSLTPRSFGYFTFTLAFYAMLLVYQSGGLLHRPLYLVMAIVFSATVFLTHRFAAQSLFLIAIAATIFYQQATFFTILFFGFVAAIVVTSGYYLRVLKGHIYNMYFWIINRDYRYWHQVKGKVSAKKNTDFVGKIYFYLNRFAPLALFGVNFWIVSGFFYIAFLVTPLRPYVFTINTWLPLFLFWIIFFYLLATLVLSTRYLLFIGEGQRYLEMSAVPTAIVSGYLFVRFLDSPYRILTLVIFLLLNLGNLAMILLVQRTGVIKDRNRSLTPEMRQIFAYINKMKATPRILCIPHYMTTMLVYFTGADIFVNADNEGVLQLIGVFPLVTKSITDKIKTYKITHILLKESFAKRSEIKGVRGREVYRVSDIVLLKV